MHLTFAISVEKKRDKREKKNDKNIDISCSDDIGVDINRDTEKENVKGIKIVVESSRFDLQVLLLV